MVANLSKSLQGDYQNRWWSENIHLFQVWSQVSALTTPHFVFENFSAVEFLQAIVQTGVVNDSCVVKLLLFD